MKKLLFILVISMVLFGCGGEPVSEGEYVPQLTMAESYSDYDEGYISLEPDYTIPEEELPFANVEHQHSFMDTFLIAQSILITHGYEREEISRILIDSTSIRNVIQEFQGDNEPIEEATIVYDEYIAKKEQERLEQEEKERNKQEKLERRLERKKENDSGTVTRLLSMVEEPKQEVTLKTLEQLPEKIILFPHPETGYDWQLAECDGSSVWVGVQISELKNKAGNYSFDIYMTSNTTDEEGVLYNVYVGDIKVRHELNECEEVKVRIQQEHTHNEDLIFNDKTYCVIGSEKELSLIITTDQILVQRIFLSEQESELLISWGYIKKLEK